jgi:hypothetical protein
MTSDGFGVGWWEGGVPWRQQAGDRPSWWRCPSSSSFQPPLGSIIPAQDPVADRSRFSDRPHHRDDRNSPGFTSTQIQTTHRRDAGREYVPREPPAGRRGGGDRRRDLATPRRCTDPKGGTTTGPQRDRDYPSGSPGGRENTPGRVRRAQDDAPRTIRRQSGLLVELMGAPRPASTHGPAPCAGPHGDPAGRSGDDRDLPGPSG